MREDIAWKFDKNTGTMTLGGSGKTNFFDYETDPEDSGKRIYHTPWNDFKDSIKKVVIGEGITYLEAGAFYNCSALEEVEYLNKDVILGIDAFRYTPYCENNAVEYDGVYYLDSRIVGVSEDVKDTITTLEVRPGTIGIATSDVRSCPNISKIVLPEGFKYLTNAVFYNMRSLEEIELPESISLIESWTLANTGIKSLTIKNPDCNIKYIDTTVCNNYDAEAGKCSFEGTIRGYDGSTAQAFALYTGYKFESIGESPDPIAHADAEGMCGKDTKWSFDSKTGTLTLSGTGLFDFYADAQTAYVDGGHQIQDTPWLYLRRYIKKVVAEDGIKYIPFSTFSNYYALEDVVLPEDCIYIGDSFMYTPFFNKNAEADGDIFYLDGRLSGFDRAAEKDITKIDVRPGTGSISVSLRDLTNLSEISIPEGVRYIENGVFYGLTKLETIDLPESVELIDAWAFCTPGLKELTIRNPECRIIEDPNDATICNEFDFETRERSYNGVIRGYAGSTAQKYADKYGYKFEALDTEAVSAPANVNADNGTVTWDAADNAYAYRVAKVVNGVTYYGAKTKDTSYTFNKVPASDYQVYVVAYGRDGSTKRSSTPLGYVDSVAVDENGNVTWDAADNAVSYRVAKAVNGNIYYGPKTEDTSYKLAYVPKKDYQVFVVAYDSEGRTTWGKKNLIEIGSLGVVTNTKVDNSGKVTWDAARNAAYYRVGKVVNGKTYVGPKTEDTSYTLASLPRFDYQVFVTAFDSDGNKITGAKVNVERNYYILS